MNALVWLADDTPLPHPDSALPDGLLAVGADLSVKRLTEAYSKGIFPWFNQGDPVLWWSPDPRMVLACADFSPSHSLRKKLRQLARHERAADARITIKMNTAFARVIAACAQARSAQNGTWISPIIQQTYFAWHQAGYVHSIETWEEGQLTGGLYGVGLGRFFFGESMFSHRSDASKLALAYLVNFLNHNGVRHIDCQQQTSHLATLGARPMARNLFLTLVAQALHKPAPAWGQGQLMQSGRLAFSTSSTP